MLEYSNTDKMKNKTKIKNLNRHLFWFITVALIVAMVFAVTTFVINIAKDRSYIDIADIESNTTRLIKYFGFIRNTAGGVSELTFTYTGILILIAIPVLGLFYALGYFIYVKNLRFALMSAGVILIIILSLIIGFMMK